MIKPGWTHILTLVGGEKRVIYVETIPVDGAYADGRNLLERPGELRRYSTSRPDAWEPVMAGVHPSPERLLLESYAAFDQGDVRIGKSTGLRHEVLAVHESQVWTNSSDGYRTWTAGGFLSATIPAATFFEEGHDYARTVNGVPLTRHTVRHVGEMPNGKPYAVAEVRLGPFAGSPVLLGQNDFNDYEDVTK